MAVVKALDLSTGHLTESDFSLLDTASELPEDGAEFGERRLPVRVARHQYGWTVFLPTKKEAPSEEALRAAGLSAQFVGVVGYALSKGCWFINFDRDADLIEGLPAPAFGG